MANVTKGGARIAERSSSSGIKKATEKPIGQPEQARDEAVIGWDAGPEKLQSAEQEADQGGAAGTPVDTDPLAPPPDKVPPAESGNSSDLIADGGDGVGTVHTGSGIGAMLARLWPSGWLARNFPSHAGQSDLQAPPVGKAVFDPAPADRGQHDNPAHQGGDGAGGNKATGSGTPDDGGGDNQSPTTVADSGRDQPANGTTDVSRTEDSSGDDKTGSTTTQPGDGSGTDPSGGNEQPPVNAGGTDTPSTGGTGEPPTGGSTTQPGDGGTGTDPSDSTDQPPIDAGGIDTPPTGGSGEPSTGGTTTQPGDGSTSTGAGDTGTDPSGDGDGDGGSTDTDPSGNDDQPPINTGGSDTPPTGGTDEPSTGGTTTEPDDNTSTGDGGTGTDPSGGTDTPPTAGTGEPPTGGSTTQPGDGSSIGDGGSTGTDPSGGNDQPPINAGGTDTPPTGGGTGEPSTGGSTTEPGDNTSPGDDGDTGTDPSGGNEQPPINAGGDTAQPGDGSSDNTGAGAISAPALTVTIGQGVPIAPSTPTNNDTNLGLDISLAGPGGSSGSAGGNSVLIGSGGDDTLRGDTDHVTGQDDDDFIDGGAGNDTITGGEGGDKIIGGAGNDRIEADFQWETPDPGDDIVDAGAGDDIVLGAGGNDDISGGSGNDLIYGDFDWETRGGNDRIDAGSGDDVAIGGSGDDLVAGGEGNDTLYGDYRWNTTNSDGNDILAGGKGDDLIYGGGGNDIAVYAGSRSEYQITRNDDGSYTVIDLVVDRDGTDRVYDIETFRFSDGDLPSSDLLTSTGGSASAGAGEIVYPVDITVSLVDADGSDALSDIVISMMGVPEGTTFSAGSMVDGNWVVPADQLDGLTMTVPADAPAFDLNVSVAANDGETGETATTMVSVGVGAGHEELTSTDLQGLAFGPQADDLSQDAAPPNESSDSIESSITATDDIGPGQTEEANADPLQPYHELADGLQPASGAEPADAADSNDDALSEQSATDDYLPFAEPPGADQPLQSSDQEMQDTDYDQMVEAAPVDNSEQQPLPFDDALAPVDTGADGTLAQPLVPASDPSTTVETVPDQTIVSDHENIGM